MENNKVTVILKHNNVDYVLAQVERALAKAGRHDEIDNFYKEAEATTIENMWDVVRKYANITNPEIIPAYYR